MANDDLLMNRRQKLDAIREDGIAFPNDFRRQVLVAELFSKHGDKTKEELALDKIEVKISGRMMSRRIMGKASFAHIQDSSAQIQLYLKRDILKDIYDAFKHWDIGDIVGVGGILMQTNSGELSIRVETLRLLTKSLRPLPEKFHGLADQELRYRQRYVDLIMNQQTRHIFYTRSKSIDFIRGHLKKCGFMEVETPMMQPLPGGATAKPFITHHNSLDMPFFLRIAPELYLKRLVVGGFEKVFEINRSFRNEGLSTKHNPEFTMLEFYQAYADYQDMMGLIETLLFELVSAVCDKTELSYQGNNINFNQSFKRLTLLDAILEFHPQLTDEALQDHKLLLDFAKQSDLSLAKKEYSLGALQLEIFEKTVEANLHEPTFITQYPIEVSPLARCNDTDPKFTDRFELFIGGYEIANGFSELNDPQDQAQRFTQQAQAQQQGDDEAMYYDSDYIQALEYGMPPTAGAGIGIDRLLMLITDTTSIREVILFPHMRSKA